MMAAYQETNSMKKKQLNVMHKVIKQAHVAQRSRSTGGKLDKSQQRLSQQYNKMATFESLNNTQGNVQTRIGTDVGVYSDKNAIDC